MRLVIFAAVTAYFGFVGGCLAEPRTDQFRPCKKIADVPTPRGLPIARTPNTDPRGVVAFLPKETLVFFLGHFFVDSNNFRWAEIQRKEGEPTVFTRNKFLDKIAECAVINGSPSSSGPSAYTSPPRGGWPDIWGPAGN
jgi:hypothetical protein